MVRLGVWKIYIGDYWWGFIGICCIGDFDNCNLKLMEELVGVGGGGMVGDLVMVIVNLGMEMYWFF